MPSQTGPASKVSDGNVDPDVPAPAPVLDPARTDEAVVTPDGDAEALQPEAPRPDGASPDPATIRAKALSHARAAVDLCRLAGQPQLASRFLEQATSLDEVRAALLAFRSEAEPEIAPHHRQPSRTSAARPWAEILVRTFKLKG